MNSPHSNFAQAKKMLVQLSSESEHLALATRGLVTDVAAGWITPQYLLALREQLAAGLDGRARFRLLRLAAADAVALQRAGHSAARLQLDREWLELNRQAKQAALAAAHSQSHEARDPKLPLSDADRKAIVDKADEILGLK